MSCVVVGDRARYKEYNYYNVDLNQALDKLLS